MAQIRISDVEIALVTLLSQAFNVPIESVVNGRNPGIRPSGRFVGFHVIASQNHDYPDIGYTEDETTLSQTVGDAVYMTARITLYGQAEDGEGTLGDLNTFVQDMRSGWRPPQQSQTENLVTIGMGGFSDPKHIPDSLNGRIVDRSYTDFSFYAKLSTDRNIDWFDKVQETVSVPEIGYEETSTIGDAQND